MSREYERIDVGGQVLADRLRLLLELAGMDLDVDLLGRVVQGSYRGDVDASGGTHDRGGAVDLSVPAAKVRRWLVVLRQRGLIAWYRTPSQGPWMPHIHGVDRGARDLSPAAELQVVSYDHGRNGLLNQAPDDGPPVDVRPFNYERGLKEWENTTMPSAEEIAAAVWRHPLGGANDGEQRAGARLVRTQQAARSAARDAATAAAHLSGKKGDEAEAIAAAVLKQLDL